MHMTGTQRGPLLFFNGFVVHNLGEFGYVSKIVQIIPPSIPLTVGWTLSICEPHRTPQKSRSFFENWFDIHPEQNKNCMQLFTLCH